MRRKEFIIYLFLFIIYSLLFINCGRHKKSTVPLDAESRFKIAKQYFDKRKYDRAIKEFKKIIFEHPGSKYTEETQYYLAKCYFLKKDYINAEIEYEFFLRNFSENKFTDDAFFELGLSYYKESPPFYLDYSLILKALEKFEDFLLKYHESPLRTEAEKYKKECINKLIKKELCTAKLYIKLKRPKSAIIYLKDILARYPENEFKVEIENLLKLCYKKTGETIEN